MRKNPKKVGADTRGVTVAFGSHGLKAMGQARIRSNQIEAARKVVSRSVGKTGRLWIRIFPDKPVTRKGTEVPMGGGKGSVDHYVFPIKPGRIIFELDGVKEEVAREAFQKAGDKFPIKTRFIKR